MRRSVLFMRVFSVVILAIVMTALFTTMIYNVISRRVFTQIKEDDLLPRARALGDVMMTYGDRISNREIASLLNTIAGREGGVNMLLGASVIATDSEGRVILHSSGISQTHLNALSKAALEVIEVGEVRTAQIDELHGSGFVGVGTPFGKPGHPRGTVFLLVPLYEAMVAMGTMNGALTLSLLMTLPMVALLVYYVVGRIVRPLRQMRDVAAGMAAGNFEARADDCQRGEVGQLGRSLNHLSTELSRTFSALTLERNRLRQVLDGLSEGIIAVDKEGRITHSNPAAVQFFSTPGLINADDEHMRLIPDESVWSDFEKVIALDEPIARTLTTTHGSIRLTIAPLHNDDHTIAGAVALLADITESERLERTRREYVANVSHEMRTPLTAMRALLEPLSEGMVNDEPTRARYYSIMLRETMRLSRLINDLMELSRLQSDSASFEVEPLKLETVFEEISGKYTAIADDHELTFTIDMPGDCPMVMSNADRLEQVMVILLDNAMKFTPAGGDVSIGVKWDARAVVVSVKDTGVGIDEKDQPYVFDRFYKADKAHSGMGSGLGLSIAREVTERLGERIWVNGMPGEGTTFQFTIARA